MKLSKKQKLKAEKQNLESINVIYVFLFFLVIFLIIGLSYWFILG